MKAFIFGAAVAAIAMLATAPAPASAQADVEKPAASKCVWSQAPLRWVCNKAGHERKQ
jgi:hypothetical protein